jgi:hypothetical protein
MTDDALFSFVNAYREEHSVRSLDRRALRRRIVAAAGRRRVRRLERLRLLLPIAATFAGSVALAASPPVRERVREAFSFVRGGAAPRTVVKPQASTRGRAAPAAAPRLAPVPAGPVERALENGAVAPPPVRSVEALPLRAATARSLPPVAPPVEPSRPVPSLPPPPGVAAAATASFQMDPAPVAAPAAAAAKANPSGQAVASADLSLYRRAHELHFGGADRARSLAAWDAYLRAFPSGTFAPEARLNRAVCLAKLGRKAEAEDVLVDIERGRFGKDGRRQARKILGALDGDD